MAAPARPDGRPRPRRARRRAALACLPPLFLLVLAAARVALAAASSAPSASLFFTSGVPPSPDLVRCLNDDGEGGSSNPRLQGTVYRDFVEGRPARLRYWSGRWSAKQQQQQQPQQQRQGVLTLASSLTPSRLDQLEAQCRLWRGGPISAVVYAAILDDGPHRAERLSDLPEAARRELDAAAASIAALHARAEADPEACALDVLLLFETLGDALMPAVVPINAMRNYALLQARTPLVAMVDVDLLPSASLSAWLLQGPQRQTEALVRACESADTLFVLPAFETPRQDDAAAAHAQAERAARAATKGELAQMRQQGAVRQFALRIFHEGHDDTQYDRWFQTPLDAELLPAGGGGGGGAYAVNGTKDYEPWYVVSRARMPWYEKFRGYGWNKVAQIAHARALGFAFRVLPGGWLVHRQHERSTVDHLYQSQKRAYEEAAARLKLREQQKQEQQGGGGGGGAGGNEEEDPAAFETVAGVNHRLRDAVVAALARGEFSPTLDEGIRGCVALLPWWRELEGSRAYEQAAGRAGAGASKEGPAGGEWSGGDGGGGGEAVDAGSFIALGPASEAAILERVLAEHGGAIPYSRR